MGIKNGILTGVGNGIIPQYNKIVTRGYTIAKANQGGTPIMGMLQWIRADRDIVYNGLSASIWKDLSGHGYDFYQGVAVRQPVPTANVLNGQAGMYFDGGDDMASVFPTLITQPFTIFIVWKVTLNTVQVIIDGINTTNRIIVNTDSNMGGWIHVNDVIYSRSMPFTIITTIILNGANSSIYENGVLKFSGTIATSALNGITLGYWLNGGYYFAGYLMEKITYNAVLTSEELLYNHNYLKQRYAL